MSVTFQILQEIKVFLGEYKRVAIKMRSWLLDATPLVYPKVIIGKSGPVSVIISPLQNG